MKIAIIDSTTFDFHALQSGLAQKGHSVERVGEAFARGKGFDIAIIVGADKESLAERVSTNGSAQHVLLVLDYGSIGNLSASALDSTFKAMANNSIPVTKYISA